MTSSLSFSENYLSFFKNLLEYEFFSLRLSFIYLEFFNSRQAVLELLRGLLLLLLLLLHKTFYFLLKFVNIRS